MDNETFNQLLNDGYTPEQAHQISAYECEEADERLRYQHVMVVRLRGV